MAPSWNFHICFVIINLLSVLYCFVFIAVKISPFYFYYGFSALPKIFLPNFIDFWVIFSNFYCCLKCSRLLPKLNRTFLFENKQVTLLINFFCEKNRFSNFCVILFLHNFLKFFKTVCYQKFSIKFKSKKNTIKYNNARLKIKLCKDFISNLMTRSHHDQISTDASIFCDCWIFLLRFCSKLRNSWKSVGEMSELHGGYGSTFQPVLLTSRVRFPFGHFFYCLQFALCIMCTAWQIRVYKNHSTPSKKQHSHRKHIFHNQKTYPKVLKLVGITISFFTNAQVGASPSRTFHHNDAVATPL